MSVTVRRPSLARVLVYAIGGVAVGAVVLTAVITLGLARLGAERRALAQLGREADRVVDLAAELPCSRRLQPRLARQFGPRVRFIPDDAPRARRLAVGSPEGTMLVGGRETYYASRRADPCGSSGTLLVLEPVGEAALVPEGFTGRLVLAGLAGLAGSVLVAYVLSRRMSRPLRELAESAHAFARGEVAAAPVSSESDPDEIADLKDSFRGMVSDLRNAREREKAFLLSVSHELRTPLTAIRGYGEALADGTAKEPRRAGDVVARESRRLERLVQDLLDLARLESGEFSVRPERVDLNEIAGSVVEALTPVATEHGVILGFDDGPPSIADTDPDRVHQMLANLVENAIRVTPEGQTVTVSVRDRVVMVADPGPGIDPSDIAHAFERFYLWSRYKGVRAVGSGLGLAIVGELAERLGIVVSVTSTPGVGSRFELRFDA